MDIDIVQTRRDRLRELVKERFDGKQSKMVEETGINAGELSGLLRTKHFGEKKARSLEGKLGLPKMWLDGINDQADTGDIVAEFSRVYMNSTDEGRAFLRNAVAAVKSAFVREAQKKQA